MNIATIAEWDSRHPYMSCSVDLSAYAGQEIFLGFRHFTTTANYALCIDNITISNAVWSGTASETAWYNIYRSGNGQDYELIGVADGGSTSYTDNDIQLVNSYYQVTAVNTIAGGLTCESAPAMSVDGIHDFVSVTTDGIGENADGIVCGTHQHGARPNRKAGLCNEIMPFSIQ